MLLLRWYLSFAYSASTLQSKKQQRKTIKCDTCFLCNSLRYSPDVNYLSLTMSGSTYTYLVSATGYPVHVIGTNLVVR